MNKKAAGGMYLFWSASIVVCLLLVFFSLLFSSCTKAGTSATPDPTAPAQSQAPVSDPGAVTDPNATADPNAPADTTPPADPGATNAPAASGAELGETADAGMEYLDKLIFLGDSTTNGLKYYGVLSGGKETTQVWVPANATLALFNQSIATIVYPETGAEISIPAAAEAKKPEYLVITLGVNGVASMNEEDFKREYTSLIQGILAVSPDTKIIVNSIYPVMTEYEAMNTGINNTVIRQANEWLKQIAADNGAKYLNSASAITGEDGSLPAEYCNDNKLHLNAEGFDKVLTYIRTHAYQ